MDEISKTIALVCFIIMSGLVYLNKMKETINEKTKIEFQFTSVNKNDENSGS